MLEKLGRPLKYLGPLAPRKEKRNLLDWTISGLSILIVVGALVGMILWQVKERSADKDNVAPIKSPSEIDNSSNN